MGGTVALDPVGNSTDLGLVYEAFTRAISRRRPLRCNLSSRGHAVVVRPPDDNWNDSLARQNRESLNELRTAYSDTLVGLVSNTEYPFAEAIKVRLELWDYRWWFVYEPYTWVDLPRQGTEDLEVDQPFGFIGSALDSVRPKVVASDWRRERWARRYNGSWHDIVVAWAKLIAPESETEVSAHDFREEGINAVFRVSWTTAWSSPVAHLVECQP